MNQKTCIIFIIYLMNLIFSPTAFASIFTGTDLYNACKVEKEYIQNPKQVENSDENMAKIMICHSWIFATYAMAVSQTNLIQNNSIK